jgi:uncharacterized membrane protein
MEETLTSVARVVGSLVEIAAVLVVAYGSAEAFIRLLRIVIARSTSHSERKVIWRNLAAWLVIGLEFALAADIIGSVISPTWQDIGELAAIAAVRTFLNYFLEKDLEQADAAEVVAPKSLRSDVAGAL